jgi:hypothetical protein
VLKVSGSEDVGFAAGEASKMVSSGSARKRPSPPAVDTARASRRRSQDIIRRSGMEKSALEAFWISV